MADSKISSLTSSAAQAGDIIPVARSGVNYGVTAASVAALVVAAPAHYNSTGTAGQRAVDATHVYFCLATNSWLQISSSGSFSTSF